MSPTLEAALRSMEPEKQEAFLTHLHGGTSADYLEDWLKRNNTPVSATTLKRHRRRMTKGGCVSE